MFTPADDLYLRAQRHRCTFAMMAAYNTSRDNEKRKRRTAYITITLCVLAFVFLLGALL